MLAPERNRKCLVDVQQVVALENEMSKFVRNREPATHQRVHRIHADDRPLSRPVNEAAYLACERLVTDCGAC
jgi:hypothetical protein